MIMGRASKQIHFLTGIVTFALASSLCAAPAHAGSNDGTRVRDSTTVSEAHTIDIRVSGLADVALSHIVESAARDALAHAPPALLAIALRTSKGATLSIHVEELNNELSAADFCRVQDNTADATDTGGKTFGKYDRRRNRIVVSRRLAELSVTEPDGGVSDFDCMHRTFRRTLQATVIHELGHMFEAQDRSDDARLSALAGGQKRWSPFSRNRVKNYNGAGSPDPYEFTNLSESFAVNLEYYVLDETYACARPGWTAYFDDRFGVDRTADSLGNANGSDASCTDYQTVLLSAHVASENMRRTARLDADRVYAIHYLHAAAGKGMASRWGHAMFRVVRCAPNQEAGEACVEDAADDLVLSYRANVADITLNYLSGLMGAYPSQLFIYEMPDILLEYNRQEFRDLISVPLDLSESEIRRFLAVTLDRFWTYEGKYYFFWNHCGTETITHLEAVLPDEAVDPITARSPRSLMRTLPRSPLASRDEHEAVVAGGSRGKLFFPSRRAEYEAAFDALGRYVLYPFDTFDTFLDETRTEDRRVMYAGFLGTSEYAEAPRHERAAVVAGILHMERLLQARATKALSDEFVALLRDGDEALEDSIREAFGQYFGQPWDIVDDDTYGVPSREHIDRYLAGVEQEQLRGIGPLEAWTSSFLVADPRYAPLFEQMQALRALEQMLSRELAEIALAGNGG